MLIMPELTNVLPLPPLIVTTLAVSSHADRAGIGGELRYGQRSALLASSVPELLKNPDVVPAPTVMVPPETSALIVPRSTDWHRTSVPDYAVGPWM